MADQVLSESNPAEKLRVAILEIAGTTPNAMQIETALHTLLVTGGDTTKRDYPPRMKPADQRTSIIELQRVADAADALVSALDKLHAPAAALMHPVDDKMMMVRTLATVARAAASASIEPIKIPDHLSPKENLALAAAMVFLQLTGAVPTRVTKHVDLTKGTQAYVTAGAFDSFLRKVFAARGIASGYENSAKSAIRALESYRVK